MSLVGASGGVYSIVLAFLANIILNFDVMTVIGKIARIIPIAVFLCLDVGAAVWRAQTSQNDPISWAAHLGGGLTGLGLIYIELFFYY